MRRATWAIAGWLVLEAGTAARTAGAEGSGADRAQPEARISFEFDGNEALSARELETALGPLREELGAEPPAGDLEDAAYELERFYASRGFRAAEVEAASERRAGGLVVRFRIEEGILSRLADLSFEGNVALGPGALRDCFAWRRLGLFGLGDAAFTEEALASGLSCVLSRYRNEGFAFAEATAAVSEDSFGTVRVHVYVAEGPKVWIAEEPRFVSDGPRAFSDEALREALRLDLPAVYVSGLPLVLKGRLLDLYRNSGYRFAEVEVRPELDREAARARLAFEISEGPLAKIERVRFEGNSATADWVLRSRVQLREGDLCREDKLRASYRSLLASGLFSTIAIETPRVEDSPDRVDLLVRVVERARYRVSVLGGFGSYELLRGKVTVEDANIFGSGHRASLSGKASFRDAGVSAEYLNPFVFTDALSHRARGFYEVRENPSYDEERYGAETGLDQRLGEHLDVGLGYRLEQSDPSGVSAAIPPELRASVLLSKAVASASFDYRDSLASPDRGSFHRLGVEVASGALGSDLDCLKPTAATSWIVPLAKPLRAVASASAGAIVPLFDTEVIPVQERFYLGGESTIRSYREDRAGPKIGGDPIGGEAFLLFNVELRVRLPLLQGLEAAVFGDAGSIVERYQDFGGGRYHFAVGCGLRYRTPFGPLRVDIGFNPDREPDESLFAVHAGLGYPF